MSFQNDWTALVIPERRDQENNHDHRADDPRRDGEPGQE
jgi:hypothetical protein